MANTSVITYNQVIDRIETILNDNPLVQTITKGDIWEVDNKEIVYPQVHIVTEGVDFSTYELKYKFRLFIMDLVEKDESNEQEVLSDTLQMLQDIIAKLLNPTDPEASRDLRLDRDITAEDFTERFNNEVAGWTAEIGITVDYTANECLVPTA